MNFHQIQNFFKLLLRPFPSASLISDEGKLIASRDTESLQSSTSRLVVYQIIKKYLNPKSGDLFISNDPDNGGLNYQNIFFTTRLTDKIYLVFVQPTDLIQFKIPPTPLFEKGQRNKTIWPFLIEQNPQGDRLAEFFDNQFRQVQEIFNLAVYLNEVSNTKSLMLYFKVVQQIFERRFNNKALGQAELICKISATEHIKLRLSIDEKQNQRTISADFSQSTGAQKICAASHIIESGLVKSLADHYGMTDLISQPLLDKIRLTLPPQSIVSKPHPQGLHNLLLQKIVREQIGFLLVTMTQAKNKIQSFKLLPEFRIDLLVADQSYPILANPRKILFSGLDYLIQSHQVVPLLAQNSEGKIKLKLQVTTKKPVTLIPILMPADLPSDFLLVAGNPVTLQNSLTLAPDEIFELNWKVL